jgi:hypothetical protein
MLGALDTPTPTDTFANSQDLGRASRAGFCRGIAYNLELFIPQRVPRHTGYHRHPAS